MSTIFGKVRTLIHLLNPATSLELENNTTHEKVVLEVEPEEGEPYTYSIDLSDLDYGEYTYRNVNLDLKVEEIGILELVEEVSETSAPEETN